MKISGLDKSSRMTLQDILNGVNGLQIKSTQLNQVEKNSIGDPPPQKILPEKIIPDGESNGVILEEQTNLVSLLLGDVNRTGPITIDISEMSKGQQMAVNAILSGKNILLTGPAGTGKSYTVEKIKKIYDAMQKRIGVTSTTGRSAIIIGGRTIHSWSGIGICTSKESALKRVMMYRKPQARIKSTELLIIDEVSMLSGYILDILDYVFRFIRQDQRPFGGIQVLLVGDFYQLSPVKSDKYAFEADTWNLLIQEVHELQHIFRQEDKTFCTALNEIRTAEVSIATIELFSQCLLYYTS